MPPSHAATTYALQGHGDEKSGRDLHHADGVHEVLGAAGACRHPGRQVVRPVDRPVEELVEAEEDRRGGEAHAQKQERLVGGIAELQPRSSLPSSSHLLSGSWNRSTDRCRPRRQSYVRSASKGYRRGMHRVLDRFRLLDGLARRARSSPPDPRPLRASPAIPVWIAFLVALGLELNFLLGALTRQPAPQPDRGPQPIDRERYATSAGPTRTRRTRRRIPASGRRFAASSSGSQ